MASNDDVISFLRDRDQRSSEERRQILSTLSRIEAEQAATNARLSIVEHELSNHMKESADATRLLARLDPAVSTLEKTVYGNGREGLETRTTRLEQNDNTKKHTTHVVIQWIVIGIAIIGLLADKMG